MKKLLSVLFSLALGLYAVHYVSAQEPPATSTETRQVGEQTEGPLMVYVCTGKTAKKYHLDADCPALSNCKDTTISVNIIQAKADRKSGCSRCARGMKKD